jgi:8-oxo-dGTP diphosphatase
MRKDEQGIQKNRYQVIPRTLVFITKPDTILLIKGSPQKRIWPNLYNGIGGHVEDGEDILHAAMREVAEETGLINLNLEFRGIVQISVENELGISIFVFLGRYDGGELNSGIEGDLEWIPINLLNEYPLVPDLNVLIPLVSKEPREFFFGHYKYRQEDMMMKFYSEDGEIIFS